MVMRSSTESEVVGVYDVLPQILWTKKFLEDQGVNIKETVLYQDNMSSMLLEQNGRQSSTKRTKHMDIQYFYVGDHIQNKTLSLQHCPTKEMLADYFTTHYKALFLFAFEITSWVLSLRMEIPQLIGVCWKMTTRIRKQKDGTRIRMDGTRMKQKTTKSYSRHGNRITRMYVMKRHGNRITRMHVMKL